MGKTTEGDTVNVEVKKDKTIIFLADASETARHLLASLLQYAGYEVVVLTTGAEILEKIFQGASPDLLLVASILPGMSGLELLARLEQSKVRISTILTSTSHNVDEMLRAFEYGALDFIAKPFNLKEVLLRVQLALMRDQTLLPKIGTA